MREEWNQRTKVAAIEADATIQSADAAAFAKSFNEPERYSAGVVPSRFESWVLVLVDAIRALVRPGLTIYLATITTYLYWDAHAILRGPMTPSDATALVNKIVETVLYLTTVCSTWYFGVRTRSKEK